MKKIKYEIYCCTNIETQKVYIGYTKLGIFKRWKKHLLNANSGLDTYFYKSIRKYGPEKWTIKKLWETFDKKEILKKEKEFIQKYECLIPLGYNSTEGGTGGDIWYGDNLSNRRKNLSKACSGINNPRYSGISDDEIITEAVALYKKYNQWIPKFWIEIVEIKKFPKFFTKFRFSEFGGGNTGFKLAVLAALKNEGFENASLKYKQTVEHNTNAKLNHAALGKVWVTNLKTKKSYLANAEIIDNTNIIKGRNKC